MTSDHTTEKQPILGGPYGRLLAALDEAREAVYSTYRPCLDGEGCGGWDETIQGYAHMGVPARSNHAHGCPEKIIRVRAGDVLFKESTCHESSSTTPTTTPSENGKSASSQASDGSGCSLPTEPLPAPTSASGERGSETSEGSTSASGDATSDPRSRSFFTAAERFRKEVLALIDRWEAIPDYAESEYDQGRVDQRHALVRELLESLPVEPSTRPGEAG